MSNDGEDDINIEMPSTQQSTSSSHLPPLNITTPHQKSTHRLSLTSSAASKMKRVQRRTIVQRIIHVPCGCVHSLHKTKTNKPLLEIFLYLIFLCSLVLYSVDLGNNSENYWITSRIEEILAKEEWGVPVKTFMDIGEREEYWEFMNGKFFESIFAESNDMQRLPSNSKQRHAKLWDGNFVFHSIRFTQLRVKNELLSSPTCKIPQWLNEDVDMTAAIQERGCYPSFSREAWSKDHYAPYPNSTTGSIAKIDECFQYSKSEDSAFQNQFPYVGLVYANFYPSNGHSCTLNASSNPSDAQQFIHDLSVSKWFDTSTRLVTVDFTLYSADVNVFVYVRMLVEQAATGGLVPYFDVGGVTFSTDMYASQFLRKIFFRLFLGIMWLVFVIQEAYEWHYDGSKKYCTDIWNIVEGKIILIYINIIIRHYFRDISFTLSISSTSATSANSALGFSVVDERLYCQCSLYSQP